jgi:hypothetical protein
MVDCRRRTISVCAAVLVLNACLFRLVSKAFGAENAPRP